MTRQPRTLRDRAMDLLARREYTRGELAGRLAPHAPPEDVSQLLDTLRDEGLQSDRRYLEMLVASHGRRHGPRRLLADAVARGVDARQAAEVISDAWAELHGDEVSAARAVWARRFGTPPDDARERGRQYRFLAGRGFSAEAIARLFRSLAEDPGLDFPDHDR